MAFPNWDCCCDSVFACDEDCFPEWDCCGGNSSCDVGWCCTLVGGSDYELPTASEYIKGGVMIGEGLKMTGDTLNVTIKAEKYTLPPATSSELGGVMVGDNLSVTAAGRLSAVFLLDTIPSTVEGAMWISNVPDIDNSD